MFAKFPEIVSDGDLECVCQFHNNDILWTISNILKLSSPKFVVGLVALITKRNKMGEILELIFNIM